MYIDVESIYIDLDKVTKVFSEPLNVYPRGGDRKRVCK